MIKIILAALLLATSSIAHAHQKNISAKSWIVADSNGEIIAAHNPDQVRSIASITKLATAMAVLDSGANMDDPLPVKLHGIAPSRSILLQWALVRSDNSAAQLLCETFPGGLQACLGAMNGIAIHMGLTNTKFVDPTGLGRGNVSTAREVLALVGMSTAYPVIVTYSGLPAVRVPGGRGWVNLPNTNPLVSKVPHTISKTGWTRAAGGSIAVSLRWQDHNRMVVILGSTSVRTRIPELQQLLNKY